MRSSMASVAEASDQRRERLWDEELDRRVDLLIVNLAENPSDRYHAVTADPRKMGYLRFLLKHYAKDPHPWAACYRDNLKRFGPRTKGLCGVLKDTIRQNASWRHGAPKGPHAGHPDAGAPGVAIGEADRDAAPAWGGHHHMADERPLSLLDELDLEFGISDHAAALEDVADLLCALHSHCNVGRVLLGLDDPPATLTLEEAA